MSISSRTPQGRPNHCPVCDSDVCVTPSAFFGDATCRKCGTLLWFLQAEGTGIFFDRVASESRRARAIEIIVGTLGADPDKMRGDESLVFVRDLGADSLDMVELVMELAEELGLP